MISKTYTWDINPKPFEAIKSGEKDIEVRLFYKNRDKLNPGDIITLTKLPENTEAINVRIVGIYRFETFIELFRKVGANHFRNKTEESFLKSIYSLQDYKELEKEYGVMGIELEYLGEVKNDK